MPAKPLSSGEVREGLETICAFLNGAGGLVLFGVSRKGALEGQQVSEQALHELAAAMDRFEPPVAAKITRTKVMPGREVLAIGVTANQEAVPYTFEGRAFERVGNTTRKMTQARYEALLLQRAHARRRWENQPAVSVRLADLDREEVLRTREVAIQQRRISAGTGVAIGDILDRLGLRRNGVITQAAQALYGTKFLPDYPQGLLKLGRFRGTTVTGPILDNRQEYLHAFAMVREGLAFLERTLPLGVQFPEGKIFREDRLALPPNALREILLNAVMHRDYADPGGYVAIAIFDDRVEIRSVGRLPAGITAAMLTGPHLSRPRNPLIADTFHRTGAVEIWGRGTNRVIEECRRYGVPPPTFEEQGGSVVVAFRTPIGAGTKSGPSRDQAVAQPGPACRPAAGRHPATHSLADDALRQGQPDQVPRSGLAAPSRCWSPGYDGPREASQLKAAVPHDPGRSGGSGGWAVRIVALPRCLGGAETRTSPTVGTQIRLIPSSSERVAP